MDKGVSHAYSITEMNFRSRNNYLHAGSHIHGQLSKNIFTAPLQY